jgi:hypothetical protein
MHPVKELHYFDTLYSVRNESVLKKWARSQLALLPDSKSDFRKIPAYDRVKRCEVRSLHLLANRSVSNIEYLDLYRPCIRTSKLLGEITPEYMILPEIGVQHLCRTVGNHAKIILIARHPVQRFISSVKLLAAHNRNVTKSPDAFSDEVLRVSIEMPNWMLVQDRLNDYRAALDLYRSYFPDVLLIAFDDLVKDTGTIHKQLETFLSVPVNKSRYDLIIKSKVNNGGRTPQVKPDVMARLERRFGGSIDYLNETFGVGHCAM